MVMRERQFSESAESEAVKSRVAATPYPAFIRIVGPVSAAPPGEFRMGQKL